MVHVFETQVVIHLERVMITSMTHGNKKHLVDMNATQKMKIRIIIKEGTHISRVNSIRTYVCQQSNSNKKSSSIVPNVQTTTVV